MQFSGIIGKLHTFPNSYLNALMFEIFFHSLPNSRGCVKTRTILGIRADSAVNRVPDAFRPHLALFAPNLTPI